MRKFITRLVLPVSILAFALFTKWWHIQTDGPDVMMYGFPFIYKSDALHTSLASHYFLLPLLADFIIYFATCFTVLFIAKRIIKFRVARTVSTLLWVFASLAIAYSELVFAVLFDNTFEALNTMVIEVLDKGFHFNWQPKHRPD